MISSLFCDIIVNILFSQIVTSDYSLTASDYSVTEESPEESDNDTSESDSDSESADLSDSADSTTSTHSTKSQLSSISVASTSTIGSIKIITQKPALKQKTSLLKPSDAKRNVSFAKLPDPPVQKGKPAYKRRGTSNLNSKPIVKGSLEVKTGKTKPLPPTITKRMSMPVKAQSQQRPEIRRRVTSTAELSTNSKVIILLSEPLG